MATDVDISNLALGWIGDAAEVSDITPSDGSLQADKCAAFYPVARRMFLGSYNWSFAQKRLVLSDIGSPNVGWLYRYAEPNSVLRPIELVLEGTEKAVDFSREVTDSEGKVINANISPAELIYVFDQTNTLVYPQSAVLSISYLLAAFLIGPLKSGDANQRQELLNTSEHFRLVAAGEDANSIKLGGTTDRPESYVSGGRKSRGY